jgi:two-component system chemotaxis sensor kinase CheA
LNRFGPMNAATTAQFQALGEKIASELVFAEPGKDSGLLPVNSFLCQMEEALSREAAPEAIRQGVRQARGWMDAILDSTGTFSKADLERFGQWAVWWEATLGAVTNQREPPPPPEETDAGKAGAAPQPGSAPTEAGASGQEPALTLNVEEDGEFLAQFLSESQEHLQNIEQGVLVLEDNPWDAETLNLIFRAFHTFKGGSGFLNLTAIHGLAHELESLLDLARQQKLVIRRPVIDLILAGADTLKQFLAEIGARLAGSGAPGPIRIPTLELLARIRALVACQDPPQPETAPAPNLPRPSLKLDTTPGEMVSGLVKVDTAKLDNLVDLVGEMMIAQSVVAQSRDWGERGEKLNRDLARLDRVTKDLQHTAMSLRMAPIRGTFQKMHRLVRDLAGKAGKNVHLLTQGEDTELDRALVEEISDPLIHMIRNSVDHGIEKPEVRRQRGKPARGTIRLNAYHQGGSVVIEIQDDGNGLNRESILAKAVETGLSKPGQELSDKDISNLILAPGFSTAERVTDLSGRGVGLDVVRRNVETLHGKIEIQSTAGQGSTFTIHLPLTMAIIDGLIVGVGAQRFIIPTLSICQSFKPAPGAIQTAQGGGEMIQARGKLRPLLRLQAHLAIMPAPAEAAECIAVLVESGGQSRCVLVDRLLGRQEVVIKSLGETFCRNRYVAGAAILRDGHVALILDPHALVRPDCAPLEAAA